MQDVLLGAYNWIKVLHLTAVIAWMCGMMYLPRLFINHFQAKPGGEAEKFFVSMERRLMKGIITPSMIATWVFGVLLLVAQPAYVTSPWFIVKFLFVLGITGIHGFYSASMKKFAAGEKPRTEKFWRMINEVPFVFLIIILIMVLVKPF